MAPRQPIPYRPICTAFGRSRRTARNDLGGGRMAVGDGPGGDSSGVRHQRASLGQGKGPDVDLVVSGTRVYATYQTPEGFPVLYDEGLELFCYARLTPAGAFE